MNSVILILAAALAVSHANPIYAWSQNKIEGVAPQQETETQSPPSAFVSELKSVMEADRAYSAILYVRPGLSTDQLAESLSSNHPDLQAILKKGKRNHFQRSFLNMDAGIVTAVSQEFDSQTFVLDSEESFESIKAAIAAEAKPFISKVYIVVVPQITDERYFDLAISALERQFEKRTFGKHISAIVGDEPFSFQQRRKLQATGGAFHDDASFVEQPVFEPSFLNTRKASVELRSSYLTSTALLGISFSIMVGFVLYWAMMQML